MGTEHRFKLDTKLAHVQANTTTRHIDPISPDKIVHRVQSKGEDLVVNVFDALGFKEYLQVVIDNIVFLYTCVLDI